MKKNEFLKGALCGALVILLVLGVVSCAPISNLINRQTKNETLDDETENTEVSQDEIDEKLDVLKEYIDRSYIGEVDEEALRDGIYKGYISGLNDPYSEYYNEEDTKQMSESTSGEYSGVGAVLTQDKKDGRITILRVYDDSPAQESGIKDGDILLKVGDRELNSKDDLAEVVTHIKGEEGTPVELTLYREGETEDVVVTVTRRKIEAQTVDFEMKNDGVGYLSISEFSDVTLEQYKHALDELEKQGMKSLIVDLRNNPGGGLQTVSNILDLMLPEGLTVYMEDKSGKKSELTSDEANKFEKPLVVLVNGNSASASEIYAGAIQDYGSGTIMGTQTYGKGVVQQIFDLKDGTSVKLTIAEYFTPKGRNIDGEGITPDKVVEYEADEENPDYDNQLEEAINYLK